MVAFLDCERELPSPESSTSSMKAPLFTASFSVDLDLADLSALRFLDFFLGRSHSYSGMKDSTYAREAKLEMKGGGMAMGLTNPTSANNFGNIQIPGLATTTVIM